MRIVAIALMFALSGVASADTPPPEVTLRAQGYGWILANAKGMTLYTFADDQKFANPLCEDACIAKWPPLLTSADVKPDGDWSIVTRKNGDKQWAFRGKPLYAHTRDVTPGDMNGDELLQKWYIAIKPLATPPSFTTFKTPMGYLLVDQKKMSLYTSDADKGEASACIDACAKTWRPMEASWLVEPAIADWTIIQRKDGTRQWAFKGKPLYRYAGDFSPGDMAGSAIKGWHGVVLEPPPPLPSWVTYQKSDGGELMADAQGHTLYAHDLSKVRVGIAASGRDMETPHLWTPVAAAADDKPLGQWSIVTSEDGARQWAYKGMPLYINNRDTEPGALNGMRATDRVWRTIMKSGQSMPGTQN